MVVIAVKRNAVFDCKTPLGIAKQKMWVEHPHPV